MKLGDKFKIQENDSRTTLKTKGWFVIRVDGKAFSTYTRGLEKPFDQRLTDAMLITAQEMCSRVQNVKLGYYQSDEISLIMSDTDSGLTSLWFDGQVQKMVSVASSLATAYFNKNFQHPSGDIALFDARVSRLESEEQVRDYLLWRQSDALKNSITMISLKHFSHKETQNKHSGEKTAMIESAGDSVSNYPTGAVQGFLIKKDSRLVTSVNPKTQKEVTAERTFWTSVPAPKMSETYSVKDYYAHT